MVMIIGGDGSGGGGGGVFSIHLNVFVEIKWG